VPACQKASGERGAGGSCRALAKGNAVGRTPLGRFAGPAAGPRVPLT
jgi:hypothetical protein